MNSKALKPVDAAPMQRFVGTSLLSCYRLMKAVTVLLVLTVVAGGSRRAQAQSVSSFGFQIPVPITAGIATLTPNDIAIDASGNIFISDFSNSERVVEIPAGCNSTSCQTVVASGLRTPTGLAVRWNGGFVYRGMDQRRCD